MLIRRGKNNEEPLYDTVAAEEPENEYDNHLLYGRSKDSQGRKEELDENVTSSTDTSTDPNSSPKQKR